MYDEYYDFCAPFDQIAEDLPPLIQSFDIDLHSSDATLHEMNKLAVSYSECQRKQSIFQASSSSSSGSSSSRSIREGKWQDMYKELKKFKSYEGHCNVPYRCDKHPKLGAWVSTQRRSYKKMLMGKKPCMSKHHYHLLNDIGFLWKAPPSGGPKFNANKWRESFEQLKAFKAKHGHCCVPQNYPENPKLGAWVHNQRTELRKMVQGCLPSHVSLRGSSAVDEKSKMNEDRVRELEGIGFVWKDHTSRYEHDDSSWMKRVEELLEFKAMHGHFRVPCKVPEYRVMKNWIKKQRYNYKLYVSGSGGHSSLTERRKQMLDDIDFMRLSTFGSSSSRRKLRDEEENKMTFNKDECHNELPPMIEDGKKLTFNKDNDILFIEDDMKDDFFAISDDIEFNF